MFQQRGWALVIGGFGLLTLGTIIDITDNFHALSRFVIIGDTPYEAVLEKVFGYLGGFILLAVGFWKWIPTVVSITRTEKALRLASEELELEIAQRRRAEEEFRGFVEFAPDGTVVVNAQGQMILVNSRTEELFAYSRQELLGQRMEMLIPERFHSRYRTHLEGYLAAPSPRPMEMNPELLGRRKDGGEFPIEISLGSLKSKEGMLVAGSIHDITDRKRTEETLRQQAQELAALSALGRRISTSLVLDQVIQAALEQIMASLAPDLVLIFLQEGEKLHLKGIAPHDRRSSHAGTPVHCVGQCLCGLAVGQQEPVYSSDILEDAHCTREECKEAGLVSFAAIPLLGLAGTIGVLGLASDTKRDFRAQSAFIETLASRLAITMQNSLLYEQVQCHAVELERRVDERTAELAVAKERAEESDRLKSAFLATMSHELRTPLNSIIGFTGILLQGLVGPLNDEQGKQLRMVRDSSRHLLGLINDILDISKIEAGQLQLNREVFDMRRSIEAVVGRLSPLAEGAGLSLAAEVAPEVGEITSDRRRVEQILTNLLGNAIKFTEKGGVRVECRVGNDGLLIRVTDTGIGIKPEDMGKVFQVFQQLHTGLNRQHEGTGLGLSICKKLVEMLGGKIWVESQWHVGSTFAFTLPLLQAEPATQEDAATCAHCAEVATSYSSQRKRQ